MRREERELQMNLVELLMVNANKEMVKKIENKAEFGYAFESDNGKEILRKKGEALGAYVERYSVSIMKNFSRKKYEKFKLICNEYNTFGDSKIAEEVFAIDEAAMKYSAFERITMTIENVIGNIFKNSKKKFV